MCGLQPCPEDLSALCEFRQSDDFAALQCGFSAENADAGPVGTGNGIRAWVPIFNKWRSGIREPDAGVSRHGHRPAGTKDVRRREFLQAA